MLWELFKSFLRIGSLTIGGGLAMLPLIQDEVVERREWISEEEFLDMLCLTQALPGAIAVNTAIMIGYRLAGPAGAVVSLAGAVTVPVLVILAVAAWLFPYFDHPILALFMSGAIAGILAVISGVIIKLGRSMIRNLGSALTAALFLVLSRLGVKVTVLIASALAAGLLLHYLPGARRIFAGYTCEDVEGSDDI